MCTGGRIKNLWIHFHTHWTLYIVPKRRVCIDKMKVMWICTVTDVCLQWNVTQVEPCMCRMQHIMLETRIEVPNSINCYLISSLKTTIHRHNQVVYIRCELSASGSPSFRVTLICVQENMEFVCHTTNKWTSQHM